MFGVWSYLRQFMYTKIVIVVDADIDARNWADVIWAISTRVDPKRDSVLVESTPIDYLDFASPVAGLGSKLGHRCDDEMAGRGRSASGAADLRCAPKSSLKVDAAVERARSRVVARNGHLS